MNIVGGVLLIALGAFMFWRRRSFAKGMARFNQQVAQRFPWVYHGLGKLWLSEDFHRAQIVGAGLLCIALGGYFLLVPSG